MLIRADITQAGVIAALAVQMWDGHPQEELERDFAALLQREDAAVFLAEEEGKAFGFAQCQLRRDYVEGTETSPVGYLEGIFVEPAYRGKGVARALLACCEQWAREQGCMEFASDCELDNTQSLAFHMRLGFDEANRIICFTKKL